jgi:hypothetical protein
VGYINQGILEIESFKKRGNQSLRALGGFLEAGLSGQVTDIPNKKKARRRKTSASSSSSSPLSILSPIRGGAIIGCRGF